MPSKTNIIVILLVSLLAILLAFEYLVKEEQHTPFRSLTSSDQPPPIPRFDWFDDIEAPVLHELKNVSTLWQSKPRCCKDKKEIQQNNREFYKACYQGIEAHPDDRDLVARCLWLMDSAYETREQRIRHNEYFIKEYFDYNRPTNDCRNCKPANISARIAMELARQYKYSKRLDAGIKLLERMSDERYLEMSGWVLAEFTTQLGKFYQRASTEVPDDQVERIRKIYEHLKPHKNNETLGKRYGKPGRFDKLEAVYLQISDK